jgi:hypothetical protein
MEEASTDSVSQALLELAQPRDQLFASVLMPGQLFGNAGRDRIRREYLFRAARGRAMRDTGVDSEAAP